jgi:hypothetical protein
MIPKCNVEVGIVAKLPAMNLAHVVPPFATRGLSGYTDKEDGLVAKVRTSKILE